MKIPWNERWQTFLVIGLAMVAGSVHVFRHLAAWEDDPNAQAQRMHFLLAILYRIGGKWLLCGFMFVVASCFVVAAVRRRRVQYEPDQW